MSGLALTLPLVPFAIAAAVVGAVLLVLRVPDRRFAPAVAAARRRSAVVTVVAVGSTLAALWAGTRLDSSASLRDGQLLALLPLAAACLHTTVVLAGELSWPRPSTRIRSARLVARSIGASVPRAWLVGATAAAGLVVLTCTAGVLLAEPDGRSVGWTSTDGTFGSSAGPFPGAFYAGPALAALVVLAALTVLVLHRLSLRPAVPDPVADAALRRATAHRVLRVATSATLGTAAAFLTVGGLAARRLGGSYAVDGVWSDQGPGTGWVTVATVVAVAGGVLLLVALAVLLVPARAVRPVAAQPLPTS